VVELQVNIKGEGGKAYEGLLRDVMMDLGVSGFMEAVRLALDPYKALFAMSVRLKRTSRPIRLAEVADVELSGEGIDVKISDEKFSPDVVKALEEIYGESVKHVSRFEISVKGVFDKSSVENLVICDYAEKMEKLVLELMMKVAPEGFRSVKVSKRGDEVLLVASEDPLTEELLEEAEELLKG